jgi:acetyl esterase/lipase
VEAIFRRTLRDGVVFTPCLFLSWDKMREEARRYHEALEQQGIPADRFEYDHPELFASYVFVQNTPTSTTGQVVVIRAGREKKRGW